MPNGFYQLRSPRDIANRVTRTEAVIEVRTASKLAPARTETDLTTTLGGTTIHRGPRIRLDAPASEGKFGDGWRLLGRELDIRTSTPLTGHEDPGTLPSHRHDSLPRQPERREVGFRFNPVRHADPGVVYYTGLGSAVGQPHGLDIGDAGPGS